MPGWHAANFSTHVDDKCFDSLTPFVYITFDDTRNPIISNVKLFNQDQVRYEAAVLWIEI